MHLLLVVIAFGVLHSGVNPRALGSVTEQPLFTERLTPKIDDKWN